MMVDPAAAMLQRILVALSERATGLDGVHVHLQADLVRITLDRMVGVELVRINHYASLPLRPDELVSHVAAAVERLDAAAAAEPPRLSVP